MTATTVTTESAQVGEKSRIQVKIHLPEGENSNNRNEWLEGSDGQVVEISKRRIRICSKHSFPFYKKLLIEFSELDKDENPLAAEVEVLGARPQPGQEDLWYNECVFVDKTPDASLEELIQKMAVSGSLDRRESQREARKEKVSSRVETITEDQKVTIADVSRTGIGVFSEFPIDVGKKINLAVAKKNNFKNDTGPLTVRALRQTEVNGGYLVGCRIIRGSIERHPDKAVPALMSYPIHSFNLMKISGVVCFLALVVALGIWQFAS